MTENMITESGPPVLKVSRAGRAYPDPETALGRGWALLWAQLNELRPGNYASGSEVAATVAEEAGLAPVTLQQLLTRATAAGVLEVEHRMVAGKRGPRARGFYRIPQS
jgi:hypothetical protein